MMFRFLAACVCAVAFSPACYADLIVDSSGSIVSDEPVEFRGKLTIDGAMIEVVTDLKTGDSPVETPDAVVVNVRVNATGEAITLPLPVPGRSISFVSVSQLAHVLRPSGSAPSQTINDLTTDYAVAAGNNTIDCLATTDANWECVLVTSSATSTTSTTTAVYFAAGTKRTVNEITAATTLTTSQSNQVFYISSAATVTLPECTADALGTNYQFLTVAALTIRFSGSDTGNSARNGGTVGQSSVGGTLGLSGAAIGAGALLNSESAKFIELHCVEAGFWNGPHFGTSISGA